MNWLKVVFPDGRTYYNLDAIRSVGERNGHIWIAYIGIDDDGCDQITGEANTAAFREAFERAAVV